MIRLSGLAILLVFVSDVVNAEEQSTQKSMGWQKYIDEDLIGSGHITEAAIIGKKVVHAASKDFDITPSESEDLYHAFANISDQDLRLKGITVNHMRYSIVLAHDNVITGANHEAHIAIVKANESIVISVCKDKKDAVECRRATEKLVKFINGSLE